MLYNQPATRGCRPVHERGNGWSREAAAGNQERLMSLTDQLRNDLKDAMRARDERRSTTIRMLLSTLKNEQGVKRQRALDSLVHARGVELAAIPQAELPPDEPLTEEETLQVVKREVKKRQDSIEAYRKVAREELAAEEAAEVAILQSYLPAQMDPEQARSRVAEIIEELRAGGAALGPGDMKRVMPVVMQRLGNSLDGRTLNQMVRELLTG